MQYHHHEYSEPSDCSVRVQCTIAITEECAASLSGNTVKEKDNDSLAEIVRQAYYLR